MIAQCLGACVGAALLLVCGLEYVTRQRHLNICFSNCIDNSVHLSHRKQAIQTDTSNGPRPDEHLIPGITNLGQGLNGGQGIYMPFREIYFTFIL